MHSAECVWRADAAWACNVLQGAAGVSDTILLVLVRPACPGQGVGPRRMDHVPGRMAARSYDF